MKNLVIVSDNFLPRWDGVARFLAEVIPRLKEYYEITLICPNFGELDYSECVMYRMPLSRICVGDFYLSIPWFSKEGRAAIKNSDVVWVQTLGPLGVLGILFGRLNFKQIVVNVHSLEWELAAKSIRKHSVLRWFAYVLGKMHAWLWYNLSSLIIVPSEEIAVILANNYIGRQKRIIHLGVDVFKFRPAENMIYAKERIGFSPDEIIIGYCGRVSREKDLVTLLRAYLRLRHENQNVRLLVVGGGVPEIEELLLSKPGVIVTGNQNNVVKYLQAMDVYVLPSLTETTSLSTMEAMSCGVPVVVTYVGKVPEYVEEGVTGYFFGKTDPYSLIKKLKPLIKDGDLRKRIGEQGRARINQLYSWELTIAEIKDIFLGL